MAGKSKVQQRAIQAKATDAKRVVAMERVEALRPQLEFALKDGASLSHDAQALSKRGIESPLGGRWRAPSLLKAAWRLGLR